MVNSRYVGKRDETTSVAPPPASASATARDADPESGARELQPFNAPRIGLVLAAATILAAPYAILHSLFGVSWWDDEGMLMAGFRSLLDGHRMYDDIYSLYGPLYNLAYGFIYGVLRVPLTHDAGRLMFAALWLICAAGFGAFAWKLTRSAPAALVSYALVLLWLVPLSESPGHPTQLCLLLLTAALFLVSSVDRTSAQRYGPGWAPPSAAWR